jgi:deoxyribose-phosphate aldolase
LHKFLQTTKSLALSIISLIQSIMSSVPPNPIKAKEIAAMIDHTLLKPDATTKEIEQLCAEALEYEFASVCVNPSFVPICAKLLENDINNNETKSNVKVCTVIGFPLGANTTTVKVAETRQAIADGATEIDMVLRVSAIKDGDWTTVQRDISAVVQEAHDTNKDIIVKVILETCLLTDDEKRQACKICVAAGADFVKTSTGFSKGGATVADIALMRETVGPAVGVKASGGVRSLADALAMIEAGATRIGASAGIQIIQQANQQGTKGSDDGHAAAATAGGGGY